MFHHTVSQLLPMITRNRSEIKTAVYLLTKRVKRTDEYDWGKLNRALKYLRGKNYTK